MRSHSSTPARAPRASLRRLTPPLTVRFGNLSKEERKAVVKTASSKIKQSFDHTHVCNQEISEMLVCFRNNDWNTVPCQSEIETMYACADARKGEPDPRLLAKSWQNSIRSEVLLHFARKRLR